ncbi:hypothetical protein Fuma_02009 [Fuerstiella marisgermanici]|uniref:Uncharacterized protein n=1 Tax=Fuerstiella marisgermanici TaxID=1891926 RepID=A0A1P8WEA4_9PLAN|nr:hypothetical protein Fuma_02009 [Fuerstiella marisgermanici]
MRGPLPDVASLRPTSPPTLRWERYVSNAYAGAQSGMISQGE